MLQQPNALKGLRILVVDDQKFIRNMVAQGLRSAGAEVAEASDGYSGLKALGLGPDAGNTLDRLREKLPDHSAFGLASYRRINCVVSDIRMAPMNGLEMLKAIRSGYSKAPPDLPVILVSAHTDEPLIGAALALDAHGFASKPVSQKTVIDCITRAMKVRMQPKPPEAYSTLIIPELDQATISADVSQLSNEFMAIIRAGDVNTLTGERMTMVAWTSIVTGDVIAADVLTKSGQLVVPAGTQVNEVLIGALTDLSHVASLPDQIPIRRKVI